jgi:squalene synthase HpnC
VVARSAYDACLALAREHYENFPVASVLLPKRIRPHVAAVYAFARRADDFADEGDDAPDVRLEKLDDWSRRLHAAARGVPIDDGTEAGAIFVALTETMDACGLDRAPFADLLSAFRQDVTTSRYETWDDLFDYCRRSANPVGRIVLAIAGYRDAALHRASDAVCTALQLTNFWQDVARDWRKGRLYVPGVIVRGTGAQESDLDRGHLSPDWRVALSRASLRTRELFNEGRGVADGVRGRLRWELRATWLGGVRILDALERADFDVFDARPTLGLVDALPIAWRALWWPRVRQP